MCPGNVGGKVGKVVWNMLMYKGSFCPWKKRSCLQTFHPHIVIYKSPFSKHPLLGRIGLYFLNEVLKWGIELMWVIQSDYCNRKLGFPWCAHIKYICSIFVGPTQLQRYHRNLKRGFSTTPLRCWKLELPPSWPPIIEGNVWMWRIYPGWWRRAIDSCFTGRDSVVPLRGFWDGYFFFVVGAICVGLYYIHICIYPAFFRKGAVFWNLIRGWYIYIYT